MHLGFQISVPASVALTTLVRGVELPELPVGMGYSFWSCIMNLRYLAASGEEKTGGNFYNIELSVGKNDGFVGFTSNRRIVQPFPAARDANIVGAYNRTTIDSAFIYREDPVTTVDLTIAMKYKTALATDVTLLGFRLYYDFIKLSPEEVIRYSQ